MNKVDQKWTYWRGGDYTKYHNKHATLIKINFVLKIVDFIPMLNYRNLEMIKLMEQVLQ